MTVRLGDVSDIPMFYRMMLATAAKNGFTARPQQYYAHFLEARGPMAKLYLAEKDGVIIAASITAELGNRVWHMYACSDRAYQADFPNELIQWQMQRDALEGGYRYFDFRGVEGYPVPENPYYGLHHYKQGFGAQFMPMSASATACCTRCARSLYIPCRKYLYASNIELFAGFRFPSVQNP